MVRRSLDIIMMMLTMVSEDGDDGSACAVVVDCYDKTKVVLQRKAEKKLLMFGLFEVSYWQQRHETDTIEELVLYAVHKLNAYKSFVNTPDCVLLVKGY